MNPSRAAGRRRRGRAVRGVFFGMSSWGTSGERPSRVAHRRPFDAHHRSNTGPGANCSSRTDPSTARFPPELRKARPRSTDLLPPRVTPTEFVTAKTMQPSSSRGDAFVATFRESTRRVLGEILVFKGRTVFPFRTACVSPVRTASSCRSQREADPGGLADPERGADSHGVADRECDVDRECDRRGLPTARHSCGRLVGTISELSVRL